MIKIRKRIWIEPKMVAAIALLIAAPIAFGATPAASQTKLTFLLNVPPAGYNAGFELAVEKGLYKAAGLDVTIEPGNGSQTTAQLIAVGKYDIGFADSAPVMKLIADGESANPMS